ncbi:MAG: hypothetical protein V4454_00375 [Pseudomonadota bacterium]
MTLTYRRFAPCAFFYLACTLSTGVLAQSAASSACTPAKDMKAAQLFGLWSASFTNPPAGLPDKATMLLQQHAEFSESLSGTVSRNMDGVRQPAAGHAAKAALAGDLDEGMLLLDESSDNIAITGTWNGEMVAGSCGRIFRGVWKDTSKSAAPDSPDVPFTLTRLP